MFATKEYVLKLQRGPLKENCWRLQRRYNDFVELHKCLSVSGIQLPLPEKKLFGNMHPDFISKRLLALQEYINAVLMNPILASSLPAKKFVDPETYNQSFLGTVYVFLLSTTYITASVCNLRRHSNTKFIVVLAYWGSIFTGTVSGTYRLEASKTLL